MITEFSTDMYGKNLSIRNIGRLKTGYTMKVDSYE